MAPQTQQETTHTIITTTTNTITQQQQQTITNEANKRDRETKKIPTNINNPTNNMAPQTQQETTHTTNNTTTRQTPTNTTNHTKHTTQKLRTIHRHLRITQTTNRNRDNNPKQATLTRNHNTHHPTRGPKPETDQINPKPVDFFYSLITPPRNRTETPAN